MPENPVHIPFHAGSAFRMAVLALSCAFAACLPAAEVLVESGSNWLFFRGRSQPSEPDATSWRNRRFCDSEWESGKASIGYGDGDDATVLQDMQNGYLTVYLRKRFQVADPAGISSLLLTVHFDDGFVCYINGKEAARANAGAAGEQLSYDSPATASREAGEPEHFDLAAVLGDIVAGENVIAVEVHNASLESSDLTFDARLSLNEDPPWKPGVFVDAGSEWKFFRGRTVPSAPDATGWRQPGFNDGGWEVGKASIGYGDDDDATVLQDMQGNYLTVYARKTFPADDPRWISSLLLGVNFDDGFVCYINGKEAARANAGDPGAELGFGDPATSSREPGVIAYFDLTSSIPDLVKGENVIAVEVHNASLDSSDLTFDARLSANEARFSDSGLAIGGEKASWGDYDGDGFVDLIADGWVQRNINGRRFERVRSVGDGIWGDFDNDGHIDIFSYASLRLFRNEGGTFRDVTAEAIPSLPATYSRGAVWGDFDGDGFADLYIGGYENWDLGITYPDLILMNEGGSAFKLAWSEVRYRARGVTACDFDGDRDLDIYVSNYRLQPNILWLNDGKGSFRDATGEYNAIATSPGFSGGHSIGAAWGDFDGDGEFDLFAGNFAHVDDRGDQPKSRFLKNLGPQGKHMFQDMGTCGVFYQESYASPSAGDFDGDGDLDLFFTTVYAVASFGVPNFPVLFRNDAAFTFADATRASGLQGLPATYQAAWADYDNDGDLDLAAGGKLYRNGGSTYHWLKVRLRGDGSSVNSAAIGAQVRATAGRRTILRQVEAGTGEGNQNDPTLHFGLGSHSSTVLLQVIWPDGTIESTTVTPDRTVELEYRFSACSAARELPERYVDRPGETVDVSLVVRNVSGSTTVNDVFPEGWRVADAGGGLVEGNTIAFVVQKDGEVAYELVPQGPCGTAEFSGSIRGPGGCNGTVKGRSTIQCTGADRTVALVADGDEITFLRGSATLPAGWQTLAFDDRCEPWEDGSLGIGYADGDDRTVLEDMQDGYAAVFGRARFDLSERGLRAQDVESLRLHVRFDDGFVAFLNGRELGRANMPAGAVGASTVAAVSVGDAPATCEVDDRAAGCAVITVPVGFLADGLNVFAFSVHNAGLASSDLSFIPTLDARLKGEVFERFRRGDVGQDERIDISDALGILGFLFLGRSAPKCLKSADANDDAEVDLADAIYLLFSLFVTGGDLPEPAACGLDPTDDGLSCFSYAPCAPSL